MRLSRLASEIRYRLRALLFRRAMEQELEDEIQHHLAETTKRLIAAGTPEVEAQRLARISIGGVESLRNQSREQWGTGLVDALTQDVRLAFRSVAHRPGFAAAVIVTIALGIAANTAIFHVADRMLLRAPMLLIAPEHTHRLIEEHFNGEERAKESTFSYKQLLDLRNFSPSGVRLVGYATRTLAIGQAESVQEQTVVAASANYFQLFKAPPVLGRYFTAAEDTISNPAPVAVISYAYWQREFNGASNVLGLQIKIGKGSYTIIGVAPARLMGLDIGVPPIAWIPLTTHATVFRGDDKGFHTSYNWSWLKIVAARDEARNVSRLQTDLTHALERSFDEARAAFPRVPPLDKLRPKMLVAPIQEGRGPVAGTEASVMIWVIAVAAAVLLIACMNVTNLLLGRVLSRRRELAVRQALGVRGRRLFGTLLTETLILFTLGAALGAVLGYAGGIVLTELFMPAGTPYPDLFDARAIALSVGLAIAAAVATTIVPAFGLRRQNLQEVFRGGMKDTVSRRSRIRNALLVVQGALSVVLLIGAALFVRSIVHARAMRLGFDVDQLMVVTRQTRTQAFDSATAAQNARELERAASAVPGVESAARALTIPLADTWSTRIYVTGIDSLDRLGPFTLQAGSSTFFKTAGTRVLRGRGVTEDDRASSPRVVILSESMARAIWPGEDALGKCIRIEADTMPCSTVVGIAEDLRQSSLTGPPEMTFYLPLEQFHPEAANLFVRSRNAAVMSEPLRRALQPHMPGDSYLSVQPAAEAVAPHLKAWRAGATVLSAFGLLALALATIGLYGVTAFDVARRTHELGVRAALGARRTALIRMVLGEGLRISALSSVVGAVASVAIGKQLQPLLFQQNALDVGVYIAVVGALLLCAVFASVVPSLRAARMNPNLALRTD